MTGSFGPNGSSIFKPILDFRPRAAFEAGHIPGAVSVHWLAIRVLRTLLPPKGTELFTHDAPDEALGWLENIGYPVTPLTPDVDMLTERGASQRRLWQPSPPLAALLPTLPVGTALDLGCGSGRDAVFLALHDWEVIAIDQASGALKKAQMLAEHEGVSVSWRQGNIKHPTVLPEKQFELILMMRFYQPTLFPWIETHLVPGGKAMIWAFHPEADRPHKAHLKALPEQIATQFASLKTITATINTIEDGRPMSLYIGEKE